MLDPTLQKRRSAAILASAEGETCLIQLPGVCVGLDGVVWCHSNELADGKGRSTKAHDDRGTYGCRCCHAVVDGQVPRPHWLTGADVLRFMRRAVDRAQPILAAKGLYQA